MTDNGTPAEPVSHRRWARRRPVRVVLMLMACLALTYVSLPWWFPAGHFAGRLDAELSAALNRKVHVGRLRLGWQCGVVIEDLTVTDTRSDRKLAQVSQIRCGLTPLTTLVTGRVDRIEIVKPQLWIEVGADGQTNLKDLRLPTEGGLLSLEYHLTAGVCHVITPEVSQDFLIDQLICTLDPASGTMRLIGGTGFERATAAQDSIRNSRLGIDVQLTVPQLNRAMDLALTGQGQVVWDNLALNDLPIPVAARLPIEQVGGVSTGRAAFRAHPDLDVDFDLTVGMKGVRLRHDQFARSARIPDADLRCSGHWDPHTDTIAVNEATYESPGVRLTPIKGADGPMLLLDPQAEMSVQAQFASELRDWRQFRNEFPQLDAWLEKMGTDVTGSATVECRFARTVGRDRISFKMDAGQSSWRVARPETPAYVDASAGINKHLQAEVMVDRTGQESSSLRGQAEIGQTHLSFDATVTAEWTDTEPAMRQIIRALPGLASQVKLRADRLEEWMSLSPWTANRCRAEGTSGPFGMEATVVSRPDVSDISVGLRLPAETALHVPDVFKKPAGEMLEARLQMSFPRESAGRIDGPELAVVLGDARLAIGDASASIDYSWITEESDGGIRDVLVFTYRLPVDIKRVDSLLAPLPRYVALCHAQDIRQFSGSARGIFRGEGRWLGTAWSSRSELDLDAGELAGRWGDVLEKRPETPLHLKLSRDDVSQSSGREHHSHLEAFVQSKGEIRVDWLTSTDRDHPWDMRKRALTFEGRLKDVGYWLSFSPAGADMLKSYNLQGAATVRGMATQSSKDRSVSLYVDATESRFDWPPAVSARRKLPGEPARLSAEMSGSTDSSELMRWEVSVEQLHLGGFSIEGLTGHLTTPATVTPVEFIRAVREIDISGYGRVELSEILAGGMVEAFIPCGPLDPAGLLDWRMRCVIQDEQISLTGWIDAVEAEWSCGLGVDYVPELRKAAGLPLLLSFDVNAPLDREGLRHVDVRQATLDLAGNVVRLNGRILPRTGTSEPTIDLETEIDVTNGGAISLLWPDSFVDRVDGRLMASLHVGGTWYEPNFTAGTVLFEKMGFAVGTDRVSLDGKVAFGESHADLDAVQIGWGTSTSAVSGRIERAEAVYEGRLGVVFDRFDAVELDDLFDQLTRKSPTGSAPVRIGDRRSRAMLASLLNQCRLQIDVEAQTCHLVLPPQVAVDADCVSLDVQLNRGPVLLSFAGLVDGGYVHGTVDTHTEVDEPVYFLQYAAERIQPGKVVDAFLVTGFPGLKAGGPLSLIDESYQKIWAGPGEFETGKGEFSIEGGTVEGRAAPRWVTRIFPGLNLAQFEFSYMHSWFEKLASGRIRHQMIFQGQFYNVYMDGYSDRDRTFRYEVGIDFLADFDSKYWASSGQGRIPLFTKTGRIASDGTLLDETVAYEPPQRILDVLLVKNNPVVTAYHAVRQQVLGQK